MSSPVEWRCPECGSEDLSWTIDKRTNGHTQNNLLGMHDVLVNCYLGCNACSETVIPRLDPEVVEDFLTAKQFLP